MSGYLDTMKGREMTRPSLHGRKYAGISIHQGREMLYSLMIRASPRQKKTFGNLYASARLQFDSFCATINCE